ncbi:MAG: flagellar hook-length control protein FliK [Burkholderiales bacterium]|nr:flagellar hook-length control protein FliK [Burkholderiales bacterium]
MTIETSAKPVIAKVPDTADSRGRKSTGQTGAGPVNGFMAILSAMDEPGVSAAGLAGEDEVQKVSTAPVDTAQVATDLIAISNPDPAMVPPVPAVDSIRQGLVADCAAIALGSATPPEARLTAAPPPQGPTPNMSAPPARAPAPATTAARAVGGVDVLVTEPLQGQVPVRSGDKAGAQAKGAPMVEQGSGRVVPDSTRVQEARFMAALDAMRGMRDRSPAEPALVASPIAALIEEKHTVERGRFQERVSEGGSGAPSLSLGTTSYASPAVQEVGAVSPEMTVVQDVSYWISQDIQNAELKLDGLGKNAVEVSISMHGNEAHVAFRTDELQARTLLEGATAHLKAAMQGEGLVLSGVSVGTSGERDTGDNERKQRQGTRHTATLPVAGVASESRRPLAGGAGRTLDLFV